MQYLVGFKSGAGLTTISVTVAPDSPMDRFLKDRTVCDECAAEDRASEMFVPPSAELADEILQGSEMSPAERIIALGLLHAGARAIVMDNN